MNAFDNNVSGKYTHFDITVLLMYTIDSTFNRIHLTMMLRVKHRLDPCGRYDLPYSSSGAQITRSFE